MNSPAQSLAKNRRLVDLPSLGNTFVDPGWKFFGPDAEGQKITTIPFLPFRTSV